MASWQHSGKPPAAKRKGPRRKPHEHTTGERPPRLIQQQARRAGAVDTLTRTYPFLRGKDRYPECTEDAEYRMPCGIPFCRIRTSISAAPELRCRRRRNEQNTLPAFGRIPIQHRTHETGVFKQHQETGTSESPGTGNPITSENNTNASSRVLTAVLRPSCCRPPLLQMRIHAIFIEFIYY